MWISSSVIPTSVVNSSPVSPSSDDRCRYHGPAPARPRRARAAPRARRRACAWLSPPPPPAATLAIRENAPSPRRWTWPHRSLGSRSMKLGLQLGYWGAQPPTDALERILEAERLGFDTVFTAEAWGSDAFGPLAWWGSRPRPSGSARRSCSCRHAPRRRARCTRSRSTTSPAAGFVLGLGVSGPRWSRRYGGPFGKPLAMHPRVRRHRPPGPPAKLRSPNPAPPPRCLRGPGSLGLGRPLRRSPTCG